MAQESAGAAEMVQEPPKQSVTVTELLGYVFGECALFLGQLQHSLEIVSKTGKLPPPPPPPKTEAVADKKAKSKRKLKEAKPKRKPTAYNLYMSKKLEQLKAEDAALTHMQAFRAASESWSQLSDEEKKLISSSMLAEAAKSPTNQTSPAVVPALVDPDEKKRKNSSADKPPGDGLAQAVTDSLTDGEGKRKKKKKKRDKEQPKALSTA